MNAEAPHVLVPGSILEHERSPQHVVDKLIEIAGSMLFMKIEMELYDLLNKQTVPALITLQGGPVVMLNAVSQQLLGVDRYGCTLNSSDMRIDTIDSIESVVEGMAACCQAATRGSPFVIQWQDKIWDVLLIPANKKLVPYRLLIFLER